MVDLFEATEVAVATIESVESSVPASFGMKVSVSQENLHRALGQVMRAVASKTTLPVLNNVLLTTDDGKLKLAATNLELAITAWVSCTVAQEGAVTIPAKSLTEWVNTLPPETVSLAVDSRLALTLNCGRNRSTIRGIDAEDFPAIPSIGDGNGPSVTIDGVLLKEMIAADLVRRRVGRQPPGARRHPHEGRGADDLPRRHRWLPPRACATAN